MGGQVLNNPLVYPRVVAAHQHQRRSLRQTLDHGLIQYSALGREQNDRNIVPFFGRVWVQDRFYRAEYWLGLEHHAMAATELIVVGRAVGVVGIGADICDVDGDQAAPPGEAHYAVVDRPVEGLGEEGQNVEAHNAVISNKLSVISERQPAFGCRSLAWSSGLPTGVRRRPAC